MSDPQAGMLEVEGMPGFVIIWSHPLSAQLLLVSFVFSSEYVALISTRKSKAVFPTVHCTQGSYGETVIGQRVSVGAARPPHSSSDSSSLSTISCEVSYPLYFSPGILVSPFSNGLPLCLVSLFLSFQIPPLLLVSCTISKKMVACCNVLVSRHGKC